LAGIVKNAVGNPLQHIAACIVNAGCCRKTGNRVYFQIAGQLFSLNGKFFPIEQRGILIKLLPRVAANGLGEWVVTLKGKTDGRSVSSRCTGFDIGGKDDGADQLIL